MLGVSAYVAFKWPKCNLGGRTISTINVYLGVSYACRHQLSVCKWVN